MSSTKTNQISVRLTLQQMRRLERLMELMALDRSAVVNHAIKCLADAKGVK